MGSEDDALRTGIIGAGAVVDAIHAPGFSACKGAELTAIHSRNRERASEVAERFGIRKVYEDWSELISAKDIDAISICTPPHTHRQLVEAAVAAGKHVLVEKPIAHRLEDVAAIRGLVQSSPTVIEVVRNERFMELHSAVREVIAAGELGAVSNVVFLTATTGPDDWTGGASWPKNPAESGGGALLDLGSHKVDLLTWMLGRGIVNVTPFFGYGREPLADGVEWTGLVALELAGGVTASVSASWLGPPRRDVDRGGWLRSAAGGERDEWAHDRDYPGPYRGPQPASSLV